MDGLTEGRIVHFVMPEARHRAAVVTYVWNKEAGIVNLFIFPDASHPIADLSRTSVAHSDNGASYTWHFIEKA